MSNSTRHTLRDLLSVLVVLAAGLFVVALATRGLTHRGGSEALAGVATVSRSDSAYAEPPPPDATPKVHIRLVVDYGDGVEKHFTTLTHTAGVTALDALLAAKAHARGIKLAYTGKGPTAFITEIEGLKNEGAGKGKKNWQFFINDAFATEGAGAAPLKPGDTIRWVYTTWQGK